MPYHPNNFFSERTSHSTQSSICSTSSTRQNPSHMPIQPSITATEHDHHLDSSQTTIKNPPTHPWRIGFNSSEFDDDDQHSSRILDSQINVSNDSPSIAVSERKLGFTERIYSITDSSVMTAILCFILLVDYLILILQNLLPTAQATYPKTVLDTLHIALDWVTALVFTLETNARLFCYGGIFYFSSALRSFEYLVSATNATFVVMWSISSLSWLEITRFIRLLRIITIIVTWRERRLKWRTRQELEVLAKLLEKEKSERTRLTKWRIESDDIAIGEKAGHGGFGTVFSGLFRGTLVAVKQLSPLQRDKHSISIEDEAITLVNLRHPNVVLFMGFVHEPSKLWIVTEYCSRGSLRDLLEDDRFPLTEGRALKLALGAARGLAYLHGQDPPVLHLDLKTSNILISSGWDAKLGDFGLSRNIENIENCFSGTIEYAAPEVLEANSFSTAADIYSFGVCLWEIAAREIPFKDESPMSVLWGVVKASLRPSVKDLLVKEMDCDFESEKARSCEGFEESGTAATHLDRLQCDYGSHLTRNVNSEEKEFRRHHSHPKSLLYSQQKQKQLFRRPIPIQTVFRQVQRCEELPRLDKRRSKSLQNNHQKALTFTRCETEICDSKGPVEHPDVCSAELLQYDIPKKNTSSSSQSRQVIRSHLPKNDIMASRFGHASDRKEPGDQLDTLKRRVTATIHKFDDRPPIVRRKEVDESSRTLRERTPRGSDVQLSDVRPKLSAKLRNDISHRNSYVHNSQTSDPSQIASATEESDAFARRMANFSLHVNNRSKLSMQAQLASDRGQNSCSGFSDRIAGRTIRSAHPTVLVPPDYVELMQTCWAQNPSQRPSASQIVWRLLRLIDGQMKEFSGSE